MGHGTHEWRKLLIHTAKEFSLPSLFAYTQVIIFPSLVIANLFLIYNVFIPLCVKVKYSKPDNISHDLQFVNC